MLAAVLMLASATLGVTPAEAAQPIEWSTGADNIWDVTTPDPGVRHTGLVRALVRDLVEYNGYMYIGGKFLDVKAPNGTTFSQPYLARFDVDTGVWDDSFRPIVDGMIYAMEITSDGRLFVSGELTGGIALYNANTGARNNTFNPRITNSWGPPAVYDIEVVGNDVYAGGTFTESQGTVLRDLAKVNATSGLLDTGWTPTTNFDDVTPRIGGRNVFGLAVDNARGRVYLAGKFGGINDNMDASYFATLNTTNGDLLTTVPQGLPPGIPNHRESFSMWMMDVQYRGDSVYVGGQGHQTMILNVNTLLPRHTFFSNRGVGDTYAGGDTQVIYLGANTIWSGCHCWGSVGEYELFSYNDEPDGHQTYDEYRQWVIDFRDVNPFGQQKAGGGFAIDIQTEQLVPLSFDVRGQAGAYAISEDSNGRVWFGGQYTKDQASGRVIEGIARFSPVTAPEGPAGLRTTTQTRERIVLNWQRLDGATSYQINRDGANVGTSDNTWHTDRNLTPGTTYTYTVQAVFADGTLSPESTAITTQTVGNPAVGPTGLRTTTQTRERIVLNWQRLDGATSYQINRDGANVGTSDNTWHTDRNLTPGTTYTYTVQAVFADGTLSPESTAITTQTVGNPAVGPTGLRTTTQTRERIVLNWQRLDGATSYQINRDGANVGTSDNTWHTDRNLTPGTTYTYTVQAVFADGTLSPESTAITTQTLP